MFLSKLSTLDTISYPVRVVGVLYFKCIYNCLYKHMYFYILKYH